MTLREADARLRKGIDWSFTGTLQHRVGETTPRLIDDPAMLPWARPADGPQKASAGLDARANALWHEQAGWIKPASLVRSWLGDPGVTWRGGCRVASVQRDADLWRVLDSLGGVTASAPLLVIAAAWASAALLDGRVALHPVRGQVSWGPQEASMHLPPFPVNGNGHFIPCVPMEQGLAWFSGSTYQRGDSDTGARDADQAANFERLRTLLPAAADELAPQFERGEAKAWSGVRCASADRRPLVGEVEPGLWVSTAMGSRGLTFGVLCAELLAARVEGEGEPLPIESRLAAALDVVRLRPRRP